MSKPDDNTPFDKGARLLSAVIAEVDLSDELKETAQAIIQGLAEFMPQLLAATATPTEPQTDDAAPDPWITANWYETVGRPASVKPAPAAPKRRQQARPRTPNGAPAHMPPIAPLRANEADPQARPPQGTPPQPPAPVPPLAQETDPQHLLRAYRQVLRVQHGHLEELGAAYMRALARRTDPARVMALLNAVSAGSSWLWRAALDDLDQA